MIQKDENDSPRSNTPETPIENDHSQEHHSMTHMATAAIGIPVGHEFSLSVSAQRRSA
jgi:hypothetical protein